MIKLTEENTTKAIERSRKFKPFVKYVAERIFDVQSSQKDKTYRVELFLINGQKFAQCSCKASEKNLVCFHITSAISVNFYRQNLKTQKQVMMPTKEEMKNAPMIRQHNFVIEKRGNTKI